MENQLPAKFEKRLDLNTASQAELLGLPGIGPTLAARIAAHRADHGRFHAVEDLLGVRGVSKKALARIALRVLVSGHVDALPATAVPGATSDAGSLPSLSALVDLYTRRAEHRDRDPETQLNHLSMLQEASPVLVGAPVRDGEATATEPTGSVAPARAETSASAVLTDEPVTAKPPTPVPSRPPAARRARWGSRAGAAALCLSLGAACFMAYGGGLGDFATRRDVMVQTERLSTQIESVKGEQRKMSERVDLLAEVAAQFPGTQQRVEAMHAGAAVRDKDAASTQATVQRLTKEVAGLHVSMRKGKSDSDWLLSELRLQLDSGGRPPPQRADSGGGQRP